MAISQACMVKIIGKGFFLVAKGKAIHQIKCLCCLCAIVLGVQSSFIKFPLFSYFVLAITSVEIVQDTLDNSQTGV